MIHLKTAKAIRRAQKRSARRAPVSSVGREVQHMLQLRSRAYTYSESLEKTNDKISRIQERFHV